MTLNPPQSRWPVLAALTGGVLGLHLLLLGGGLPWPAVPSDAPDPAGETQAVQTRLVPPPEALTSPAPAIPVAEPASTLRWITPPMPTPLPASPAPAPPTQAPARTPPTSPAPANTAVATAAPPETPPDATPDTPPEPVVEPQPPLQPDQADPAPAPNPGPQATTPPDPTPPPPDSHALPPLPVSGLLALAPPAQQGDAGGTVLPPAQPAPSAQLRYDIHGRAKGLSYSASATLDWRLNGGHYEAQMEARAFLVGTRTQTSSGRLGASGLQPDRFADRSRSEKAAHFDRVQQRIRFSSNAPDSPLQPGAQDRLSVFLQLGALFNARPTAYAAGQTIRLQVAGTGDAETWAFAVGDEETLALPAGSVRARKLMRGPRREFDNTVEVWLAPALHHLPVRVRITEPNGNLVDQQLSQLP